MNRFFVILAFLVPYAPTQAQKPPLDTPTFDKWPRLSNIQISNDGRFSLYTVIDPLHHTHRIIVKSNRGGWSEASSTGFQKAIFTTDSRLAFFINGHDSLVCIYLGTRTIAYLPNIRSFSISNGPIQSLAYEDSAGTLTLRDISSGRQMRYRFVSHYGFDYRGRALVVHTGSPESVLWIDLATRESSAIHTGGRAGHDTFDPTGQALAFTVLDTLFYYHSGMASALPLIIHSPKELSDEAFNPNASLKFNQSGDRILVDLKKPTNVVRDQVNPLHAHVDIWNYKDAYLQSEQLGEFEASNIDLPKQALINVQTGTALLVNPGYARLINEQHFDHYLISELHPAADKAFYNPENRPEWVIISSIDGLAFPIGKMNLSQAPVLSPDNRFLVWFDSDSLQFFACDIQSRITRNISGPVPSKLYDEDAVAIGRWSAAFEIAAWDTVDNAVYLYDKYDLWKVSLDANKLPVNLTNGYGRKNRIVFGVIPSSDPSGASAAPIITPNQSIILSGYDPNSKDNGFWELAPQRHQDPLSYGMVPYCYYIVRTGSIGNITYPHSNIFLKAKNASGYLVQKMDAHEYPNIYYTQNFQSYNLISDLHPEKSYNWFRSRLITWTMNDGRKSQGILYLPEDFDSTKKYPLLMNYYEKESDDLHDYKVPDFTGDLINVPYYVSNGYVMFIPDIYYQPDHIGLGVLNSVLSAAHYLASFSWIDSLKMGIQGHSFAGWETDYLVTHSHIFAAAGEGAGVSDIISSYDQLSLSGSDRQCFYEIRSQGAPYGIGVTPWTNPDVYIENSPILFVGNVTTPLLMMHGDADPAVPFPQAIEMYLAMRRAGKKVWLLQYEHAYHGLSNEDAVDYTLRLKQYFDYYLKGALPPRWMTKGVPASLKGIDSGLELDKSGAQP